MRRDAWAVQIMSTLARLAVVAQRVVHGALASLRHEHGAVVPDGAHEAHDVWVVDHLKQLDLLDEAAHVDRDALPQELLLAALLRAAPPGRGWN